MAPSKRQNNGRSPLVNPQRQITAFFSKSSSPSTSPSPSSTFSKLKTNKSKSNSRPNPNPSSDRSSSPSPGPSPSPPTPSPFQSNPKKPRLVIGQTPSPPPSMPIVAKSFGDDVVGKRLRVYWPLDKAWYEGCVKSFDKESNKHSVEYDDDEEESLDLGKEKIEWVHESVSQFKRLRRGFKKVVIEDDDEMENVEGEKTDDKSDSSDDDWNDKNLENEQMSDGQEVDLVDEKEDKVLTGRKRKASGVKKSKNSGAAVNGELKVFVKEPVKNVGSMQYSV